MPLPDFPVITDDILRAIAARHGLKSTIFPLWPQVGTFNAIYGFDADNLILRVPRNHPRFTDAMRNEAIAVPLVVATGVKTPALAIYDDSLDLIPVPYGLWERVPGAALELSVDDPATATSAWTALGHDLALVHAGIPKAGLVAEIVVFEAMTDPRPLPAEIARVGYFTAPEARWLTNWLDRLAPVATAPRAESFLHGDTQSANIIVDPSTLGYAAVIDWGSCRWGDVAEDFAGIPIRAVPPLLDGYREAAGAVDDTIEARILWRHLTLGLHQLRGTPKPDLSWGERPMTHLFDVFRFFTARPSGRWRQWAPQPR
jgi:aminoglycoside phosphotransferase (APT) family kinase protein